MLAFLSDPKIKAKYLRRVRAHVKADEIRKGQYWENGKGCAVGCTIHSSQHLAYETELGIPQMLAKIEETIFEGATDVFSQTWPERFLKAIKPGADLSRVGWKFQHWLLMDPTYGTIKNARPQDRNLFLVLEHLLWNSSLGKFINETEAYSVEKAAYATVHSNDVAMGTAVYWANNAAWSSACSVYFAACSQYLADKAAQAYSVAHERHGEYLLALLKEAK